MRVFQLRVVYKLINQRGNYLSFYLLLLNKLNIQVTKKIRKIINVIYIFSYQLDSIKCRISVFKLNIVANFIYYI